MPSPRTTQRCAKFHPALAAWEREFFLTRFAAASVVTERPVFAGTKPTNSDYARRMAITESCSRPIRPKSLDLPSQA